MADKDFNKILSLLNDDKEWRNIKPKLEQNRANLLRYSRAAGPEVERLKRELVPPIR